MSNQILHMTHSLKKVHTFTLSLTERNSSECVKALCNHDRHVNSYSPFSTLNAEDYAFIKRNLLKLILNIVFFTAELFMHYTMLSLVP